jgi:hypothetical protein
VAANTAVLALEVNVGAAFIVVARSTYGTAQSPLQRLCTSRTTLNCSQISQRPASIQSDETIAIKGVFHFGIGCSKIRSNVEHIDRSDRSNAHRSHCDGFNLKRWIRVIYGRNRCNLVAMKKLGLVMALLLAAGSGCKKDDSKSKTSGNSESPANLSRLSKALEARAAAAINEPQVEKTIATLIDGVFKDPRVANGAQALIAQMTADATISKGYEDIVSSLSESSAVKHVVQQVMAENPGANAETIGEIVGAKVEKIVEGPAFSNAIDRSMDILLARPEIAALFDRVGPAMMTSPEAVRVFSSAVDLSSINESMFSDKKLAAFYIDIFSLPVVKDAMAGYLSNILSEPTVRNHLIQGGQGLLSNEAFRTNAKNLMKLVFDEVPDSAAIETSVRGLFADPAVGQSISTALQNIANDPAAQRQGNLALAAIAKDPKFSQAVKSLLK